MIRLTGKPLVIATVAAVCGIAAGAYLWQRDTARITVAEAIQAFMALGDLGRKQISSDIAIKVAIQRKRLQAVVKVWDETRRKIVDDALADHKVEDRNNIPPDVLKVINETISEAADQEVDVRVNALSLDDIKGTGGAKIDIAAETISNLDVVYGWLE